MKWATENDRERRRKTEKQAHEWIQQIGYASKCERKLMERSNRMKSSEATYAKKYKEKVICEEKKIFFTKKKVFSFIFTHKDTFFGLVFQYTYTPNAYQTVSQPESTYTYYGNSNNSNNTERKRGFLQLLDVWSVYVYLVTWTLELPNSKLRSYDVQTSNHRKKRCKKKNDRMWKRNTRKRMA